MKKLIAVAVAAAGLTLLASAPSSAGQVCYDVNVNVAGQAPIAESGCQDIPDLPAAP